MSVSGCDNVFFAFGGVDYRHIYMYALSLVVSVTSLYSPRHTHTHKYTHSNHQVYIIFLFITYPNSGQLSLTVLHVHFLTFCAERSLGSVCKDLGPGNICLTVSIDLCPDIFRQYLNTQRVKNSADFNRTMQQTDR